jgi:hypothetical protein
MALVQTHPAAAPETAESAPEVEVTLDAADWPAGGPTWRELLDHYGLEQDALLGATLAANRGSGGCPNPDARIGIGGPPIKLVLENTLGPSPCAERGDPLGRSPH